MVDLAALTVEHFRSHLAEPFEIETSEGERKQLVLAEATELRGGAAAKRDPFSIVFEDASGPMLPQGTYAISHPEIGRLEIFIVPLQPRDGTFRYEAVFA